MDDSQQRTSVNEVTGSVHPDPKATINGDPPLLNTADRGFISSTKMDKIAECTDPNSAPESTVSFEVGQVSITKSNGIHTEENGTVETNSKLLPEAREVSIKEAEEAGGNEDLEKVLPDGPDHQAEIENDIEVANGEMETQMGVGQKKRKKRKPKSKRGLNAPTGFEDYYVDPPVTPAEHEEEKSMYDRSYPFAQRIERAIQRFVRRRNLYSDRKNLFDRYLIAGGIEAGPKMFSGGIDAETIASRDAAEIAELRAAIFVSTDKIVDIGKSDHVVDFEGCLAAFLSSQFPGNFELDSEEKIKYYVGTIRNFLNYLLHHDVCPEYNDQINGARVICDKAVGQLWTISQCTPLLPGDFNTACSEIFGGMYHGMYSADMDWMAGMELDHQCGISPEQARSVFKYALAANADEAVFETYKNQLKEKNCSITSTEDTGLDVVEISFADAETLSLYARPECAGLAPVGKLKAKTWINPTTLDEDLTEEEEAALASAVPEIKYYEFWVEDKVLQKCFVGMKLEATVTQLSFGVFYFDAIYGVHCSFYQVLPNKLMRDWREPEKEWLPPRKKFEQHSSEDLDYQEEAAGSRESKPTNNNAVEEQEKVDMDDETAATQDLGASAGPAKQVVEENLEKDQDQGSNGVE